MTEKIKELEKKIRKLEKKIQKNKEENLFMEIDFIFQSIKSYKGEISKRLQKVGSVNRKLHILKEVLGHSTPNNNNNNIKFEEIENIKKNKNIENNKKCVNLGLYFFFVKTDNIHSFIIDYKNFKEKCEKVPKVNDVAHVPISKSSTVYENTYLIYIGKSERNIIDRIEAHITYDCQNKSTSSLRLNEFSKENPEKDYRFHYVYYHTCEEDYKLILKMLEDIYREELKPILGQ